jgi:hypothetical protein
MARVLFLHGSNAGPHGPQAEYLERHGHLIVGRPRLPYPRYRRHSWKWCLPCLDRRWFHQAAGIAQETYDTCRPGLIVGVSMGGAVAMNLATGDTPLILVAPTWRLWEVLWFGRARRVKAATVVVHGDRDRTVFPRYSRRLLANSRPGVWGAAKVKALAQQLRGWAERAGPGLYAVEGRLILVRGEGHRCKGEAALSALLEAVEVLV